MPELNRARYEDEGIQLWWPLAGGMRVRVFGLISIFESGAARLERGPALRLWSGWERTGIDQEYCATAPDDFETGSVWFAREVLFRAISTELTFFGKYFTKQTSDQTISMVQLFSMAPNCSVSCFDSTTSGTSALGYFLTWTTRARI
jgi:hypothetical protein